MDLGHLAHLPASDFNIGIVEPVQIDRTDMTSMLRDERRAQSLPRTSPCQSGFSLLELCFVLAVSMIVAAIAMPAVIRAIRTVKLQESAIDYASLLQRGRMRAVQDDRFYSVWVQPATANMAPIAYIDIYPQQPNGLSGNGDPAKGGGYNAGPPADPMVMLSSDVQLQPEASAPNTTALKNAFCAACMATGSGVKMLNTGPTWGPSGLPCQPGPSASGAGTVCNAAGGPIAYISYFQSSVTKAWEAITVTPAGRVQVWSYNANNSTWSTH